MSLRLASLAAAALAFAVACTGDGATSAEQAALDQHRATGGGVRILAAANSSHGTVCGNDLAATTFRFGICVCDDAAFAARIETQAFSSSDPSNPEEGGGLAANGRISAAGDLDIGGSLVAGGDLVPVGAVDVSHDMIAGGDMVFIGDADVGGDAYVGGDLTAIGLDVDGVVHANQGARLLGVGPVGVVREVVSVNPPCGCGDDQRTDVVGIVDAARTDNDNAANAIDQDGFNFFAGDLHFELAPGRYYFTDVAAAGHVEITVTGPTAIFVDGDFALAGYLEVLVEGPDASLDLFIKGNLAHAGALDLGSVDAPSKVRVYVGGPGDIAIAGDVDLGGSLYAPNARVALAGSFKFNGALVAGDIAQAGELVVAYDTDILDGAGGGCDGTGVDPVDPDGGGAGDPGEPPVSGGGNDFDPAPGDGNDTGGTCSSTADCGNQACNGGVCGDCAGDLDCAAPLQCIAGTCVVLSG